MRRGQSDNSGMQQAFVFYWLLRVEHTYFLWTKPHLAGKCFSFVIVCLMGCGLITCSSYHRRIGIGT
jgi:hypothetical protein